MPTRNDFLQQLGHIEELICRLADKASADVRAAGMAASGDRGAEAGILEGRKPAERLSAGIESACLDTLLLQQPLIGDDLRFVTASFRIVSDLRHIDGMTRDIAFICSEFPGTAPARLADVFVSMSARAAAMVDGSVKAFRASDEALARSVIGADDEVDRLYGQAEDLVVELIKAGDSSARSLPELLMLAKYFERIGDHAQRIADWALFRATGERILDEAASVPVTGAAENA